MKKYSSGSFIDAAVRVYGSEADTITSFPATIYADGENAAALIKGNLQQSGTPTPTSPIYPTECGNKTANLCSSGFEQGGFSSDTGEPTSSSDSNYTRRIRTSSFIELDSGTYTISANYDVGVYVYDLSGNYQSNESFTSWNTTPYTFQIGSNRKIKLIFRNIGSNTQILIDDFDKEVMLNTGSTALPYEPYGYKIPILSGNSTTNIYLAEKQSKRNIKKLVFDGTEDWEITSGNKLNLTLTDIPSVGISPICSHYQGISATSYININNNEITVSIVTSGNSKIAISDERYTNKADFLEFLSQQYSAGTPVTVWYVLSESSTGILNEPLRKIGDNVDTVSATVPTLATAESITVDTTLKPSAVQLTYTGWHTHDDKKRSGGAWT